MALNVRLLGRGILRCHGLRLAALPQCRSVTLEPRCATIPPEEGHDERNMRLCRPQSPHLTIYKFQLTSLLSITHRFTGIALSGYAAMFAITSLTANRQMGEIIQTLSYNYPTAFFLFKAGMVFPFTYHFFNGIRHLVWDGGKSLTLAGVYKSGYVMLLAAGVTGVALFFTWDTGNALSMKGVYISGYVVLFLTIVTTILLLLYSGETSTSENNDFSKKIGLIDPKKCVRAPQPPPVPVLPPLPPSPPKPPKSSENGNDKKSSKGKNC